jgi:hypothetical protein
MIEDGTEGLNAERTKARDALADRAQVSPRKEKGLWNFLTWSFFLSLVMSSEAFSGSSAHAAEGDSAFAKSHDGGDADPNFSNDPSLLDTSSTGEEGAKQTFAGQSDHELPVAEVHRVEQAPLGKSGSIDVEHAQSHGQAIVASAIEEGASVTEEGALSGSNPGGDDPVTVGNGPETGGHVDLPIDNILSDVGSLVSNVGDGLTGLLGDVVPPVTEVLHGVVGSLDDIVEHAISPLLETASGVTHLLDTVLDGATAGIAHTASDVVGTVTQPVLQVAEPVLNVVGDVLHSVTGGQDDTQGLLGSAGSIVVQPVAAIDHLADDLFQNGRYSDYNMELQASGDVSGDHANASINVSGVASLVTDLISGGAHDDHHDTDHAASQPLTLPSVLDELGSRLHDGIA